MGHKRACDWIQCTLILYNLLLDSDSWTIDDMSHDFDAPEPDAASEEDPGADADGIAKREILARYLSELG